MKNHSLPPAFVKIAFSLVFAVLPALALAQDSSPDGSLVWSYPIKVPPGRNGMGPSLSINYNSSGGNSFLGMGMQLGGLSAITRDQSYGINFDGNDHFLLDGQKLVKTADWVFHPERETYQKIECSGDPNDTSSYWIVTAKNGTRYFYGYDDADHDSTNDGRIAAVGQGGKALVWLLSRVEDVHGNYYVIEYLEDAADGDYYPTKITYTKNTTVGGISKYHTIELSYETRTDATLMYLPKRFKMDRRLKWISVLTGGNLVRKYRLDYDYGTSTQRSRLTAIQEYGSDGNWPTGWNATGFTPTGSTLPATTLEWSDSENSFSFTPFASPNGPLPNLNNWLIPLDFDGDGKTDLFRYNGDYGMSPFKSNGDGTFTYTGGDIIGTNDWQIGDINGDGRSEVCWGVVFGEGDLYPTNFPNGYVISAAFDFNGDGRTDRFFWNNQNVMTYLSNGDGTFTLAVDDPNCLGLIYGEAGYPVFPTPQYVVPLDFNGDGKMDFCTQNDCNNQVYLFKSNGNGSFTKMEWSVPGGNPPPVIIDVNGDGKSDMLFKPASDNSAKVYISKGDGTFTVVDISNLAPGYSINGWNVCPIDFNCDGRTDLFLNKPNANSALALRSNGDGTFDIVGSQLSLDTTSTQSNPNWKTYMLDYNGDGKNELILQSSDPTYFTGNPVYTCYLFNTDSVIPDLLKKVNTPLGGSAEVTYTPAAQIPGAIDSNGKSYPYTANTRPRQLVTRITLHDGLGHTQSVDFDYHNGKTQNGLPQDRKSLGFEWVTRKDSATGTYTKTWYNQTPPLHGLVSKVEVYDSANHLYSQTTYQYGTRDVAAGVKFVYKTQERVFNYDNDTNADEYRIDYAAENYDDYGNLTEVVNQGRIDQNDPNATYDDMRVETDWIRNLEKYIFVPKETRTYAYNLQGVFGLASRTHYRYDNNTNDTVGDRGLVTRIEYENGDVDPAVTFGYDNYGNLVWTRDPKATEAQSGYTSQLTYDGEYKAYLVTATNTMNHSGTIAYDSLMRPVSTTDANNVTSTVVYDVFSRTIKSILPGDDGTNPAMKVDYFNTPSLPTTPAYVLSQAKESGSNYLQSYRYFDGLGRVIQTKTENIAPDWTTIDYYYDASGRLWKQSVPYGTNGPGNSPPLENPVCTYVEFDALGRVIKSHNTDGTFSEAQYNRRVITAFDELGRPTVRETGGNTSIVKNYLNGHLYATTTTLSCWDGSRITDNDNNVIETALDLLGRSLSFSDPDMGTWTYEYDLNSNLIAQKDAINQGTGKQTTLEYDVLNRPIRESFDGQLNAEYWYDGLNASGQPDGEDHGPCQGRLTRTIWNSGSGGSESYKYDARGRIVKCTVTIGGYTKDQEFTYDSMDRVTEQRYPVGTDGPSGREIVTPAYGADGNITGISGRAAYASGMTYKVYGKLAQIIYGNGVATTYSYYDDTTPDPSNDPEHVPGGRAYSFRLKGIHAEKAGLPVIADTQYQYDAVDNVKEKHFADGFGGNYNEIFDYDDFNRLTQAQCDEFYGVKTYQYSNLNNILQKNGWDYQYETYVAGRPAKLPHAVSTITKNGNPVYGFTYDKNGNLTTQTGLSKVEVQAKRSADSLASPVMQLWVNGEKQTGWTVVNTEYSAYKWSGWWDGTSKIDVVFVNGDGPEVSVGNLFVDCVKVNGVTVQSESASAYYDEGTNEAEWFDGQYTQTGVEQFSWSGALRFTVTGAPALTRLIGYDYCNRVTSIQENGETSLYSYNSSGRRVSKVEGNTTTLYFFANYELEITGSEQTQVVYYYVNGQQIAQRKITDASDTLFYIHKDHLGSAVRLTNTNGNVVQSLAYDPFGLTVYSAGVNEPTNQLSPRTLL